MKNAKVQKFLQDLDPDPDPEWLVSPVHNMGYGLKVEINPENINVMTQPLQLKCPFLLGYRIPHFMATQNINVHALP